MARNNTDPRVDVYIEAVPEWQQALTTMLRRIIANNRAGAWRELKAKGHSPVTSKSRRKTS